MAIFGECVLAFMCFLMVVLLFNFFRRLRRAAGRSPPHPPPEDNFRDSCACSGDRVLHGTPLCRGEPAHVHGGRGGPCIFQDVLESRIRLYRGPWGLRGPANLSGALGETYVSIRRWLR